MQMWTFDVLTPSCLRTFGFPDKVLIFFPFLLIMFINFMAITRAGNFPLFLRTEFRRAKFKYSKPDKYFEYQRLRRSISATGYSLEPFDRHKCIFVHIPKCAGISVNQSLFGNKAGGHLGIEDYQIIFSWEEYRSYFKFAFVRNPWDRVFSVCSFLKKGGRHPGDRRWAEKHLSEINNFEDFVKTWVTKENVRLSTHLKPQAEYIFSPNGKKLIDFIGYYENLEEDYNIVRKRIGVDTPLLALNKTNEKTISFKEKYDSEIKKSFQRSTKKMFNF